MRAPARQRNVMSNVCCMTIIQWGVRSTKGLITLHTHTHARRYFKLYIFFHFDLLLLRHTILNPFSMHPPGSHWLWNSHSNLIYSTCLVAHGYRPGSQLGCLSVWLHERLGHLVGYLLGVLLRSWLAGRLLCAAQSPSCAAYWGKRAVVQTFLVCSKKIQMK